MSASIEDEPLHPGNMLRKGAEALRDAAPAYPEHEKLRSISDQSQAIGEFLEWLQGEQGVRLIKPADFEDRQICQAAGCYSGKRTRIRRGERQEFDCPQCDGSGFVDVIVHDRNAPFRFSIPGLLAEFFGIDEGRLEAEKRAMLDALRSANLETGASR